MDRRTMMAGSGAAAVASLGLPAAAATSACRVVLVDDLFADGSGRSDVIVRLQRSSFNVTAVQNPLTTLDDAADAVRRVLARSEAPA